MSSKLSATMARSLTNLGETPVGDWLNALNARKIHALSTYSLSTRGLIERVNIPCDPAGCACVGASKSDPGHPAPHYRITDAGRDVLKALAEAPAPAPKTPRPAPVAKPAPKNLTAPARDMLSAIAAGQVTGTYATSYPVKYDGVAPSPVEGLHLGSFDWTEPASDTYPFSRHHVVTASVARLIGYGYATVRPGEVETLESGHQFMTGAPVLITDAGREALGLTSAEAPELDAEPEPAEVAPAAKPLPKAPVTAAEHQLLEQAEAGDVTGTYVSRPTWFQDGAPKLENLNAECFMFYDRTRKGKAYDVSSRVVALIASGLLTVEPGEVVAGADDTTRSMRAAVVLTAAGREALGLAPAESAETPAPATEPAELPAAAGPAPAVPVRPVPPGIHVTGVTAPVMIRYGDVISALAEDGESVAWTVTMTPRATFKHPKGFTFTAEAVCDEAGRPRHDSRVLRLPAGEIVELVTAVPDYRTGATGPGARDIQRATFAGVPTLNALVYVTDMPDPADRLVWAVEGKHWSTVEGAPYISLRLRAVATFDGTPVTRRWLDYGRPASAPALVCKLTTRD